MRCTYQSDGKTALTLDSPETLAGISAYINGEEGQLRFEDTIAALPLLDEGRLTPLKLAYLFGCALSQDYIAAVCREGDGYRATYLHGYDEDELTADVYFTERFLPQVIEVSKGGEMLLAAEITDFSFTYTPIQE
jgi:hypothetical protein